MSKNNKNNLTKDQVKDLINDPPVVVDATTKHEASVEVEVNVEEVEHVAESPVAKGSRSLLMCGMGDGGGSMLTTARPLVSNSYCIAYNTSARGLASVSANSKICPQEEDGSGKVRSYSLDILKSNYQHIVDKIEKSLANTDVDYALIFGSTDGGTASGSVPALAKLVVGKFDYKTIIVGTYPTIDEDAVGQLNCLEWQSEVAESKIPYMIFDNNKYRGKSVPEIHAKVNKDIANATRLISGDVFTNKGEVILDNQDLRRLLETLGQRLFVAYTEDQIKSTESLDDYIINMIESSSCVSPSKLKGIGLFLKGPKETIDRLDVAIPGVLNKYGNTMAKYKHIEYSETFGVGFIAAGCSHPVDRLSGIKSLYNDIMSEIDSADNELEDLLGDVVNPLLSGKKKQKFSTEDIFG